MISMRAKHLPYSGFSLVEMSIVLIVIAIISAVVISSDNILSAGQAQRVVKEVTNYRDIVNNFYEKYQALPGDINDADALWDGSATGDTNESISLQEGFRAWYQLKLEGLLEAKIVESADFTTATCNFSTPNVPLSLHPNTGYFFDNALAAAGTPTTTTYLGLGGDGASRCDTVMIVPSDAYSIDEKLDDGKSNSGKVLARNAAGAVASYDLDEESPTLYMMFTIFQTQQ